MKKNNNLSLNKSNKKEEIKMKTNIFGRVKNIVDLNVNAFKVAKEMAQGGSPELKLLYHVDGYPVYHSNETMVVSGLLVAVAIQDFWFGKRIIVDDNFKNLSKEAKEFTIAHEIGHFEDEDLNLDVSLKEKSKERVIAAKQNTVIREEAFADTYASLYIGVDNGIKALKEIREVAASYRLKGRDKEMDLRIKNLEKLKAIGFFDDSDSREMNFIEEERV